MTLHDTYVCAQGHEVAEGNRYTHGRTPNGRHRYICAECKSTRWRAPQLAPDKRPTAGELVWLALLDDAGRSDREIADLVGCDVRTVRRQRAEFERGAKPPRPRVAKSVVAVAKEFTMRAPAKLYGSDIAESTGASRSTIYPLLARMEEEGWLESVVEAVSRSPSGTRRRWYRMTELGHRELAKIVAESQQNGRGAS